MIYTINTLKHRIFEKVYNTYQIFQDFYGEIFTDLQGVPSDEVMLMLVQDLFSIPKNVEFFELEDSLYSTVEKRLLTLYNNFFILVWWPNVTVTNEYEKSINIQDLYAKVPIKLNGTIPYEHRGFELTRSTFTLNQYVSGYIHSHIPSFYGVPRFDLPCLGTGPIRNTILSLQNNWDEMMWMLFCQELALYVTVESLTGGPYIRMENVGRGGESPLYSDFSTNPYIENLNMEDFISYYLKNGHLSLAFHNGEFICGLSFYDYIIDISNSFIAWYNQSPHTAADIDELYERRIVNSVLAANGKFYKTDSRHSTQVTQSLNGSSLNFTFKGKPVTLKILERNGEVTETKLLSNQIATCILNRILRTINYHYNGHNSKQKSTESSSTGRKVIYI